MTIEDLVQQAQAGDQAAFQEVCRLFQGLVKKHARPAHMQSIAAEAEAEGWLAVTQAIRAYDKATGVPFAGYAESRVRFAVWNLFKREKRRWQQEVLADGGSQGEEEDGDYFAAQAARDDTAGEVETRLLAGELAEALQQLSERQRTIILQTIVYGYGLTELSRDSGITPQAVYNLRQRGLTRLKVLLAGMYESERG